MCGTRAGSWQLSPRPPACPAAASGYTQLSTKAHLWPWNAERNHAITAVCSSAQVPLFRFWMFGSSSFRRAQLPTWAFLPARHVALARDLHIGCVHHLSINPAGPVREKERKACHGHPIPHPKVFGPRMAQTKCTSFWDMQTSHGGAANQKALPPVCLVQGSRRSAENFKSRNCPKSCQDTWKDFSTLRNGASFGKNACAASHATAVDACEACGTDLFDSFRTRRTALLNRACPLSALAI